MEQEDDTAAVEAVGHMCVVIVARCKDTQAEAGDLAVVQLASLAVCMSLAGWQAAVLHKMIQADPEAHLAEDLLEAVQQNPDYLGQVLVEGCLPCLEVAIKQN